MLPALSLDGILWCKVVEGAFNTGSFNDFIADLVQCMQPFPNRNSVIIMDNARIHKSPELVELVKSQWVTFVVAPYAYSVDINHQQNACGVPPGLFPWPQPHWGSLFMHEGTLSSSLFPFFLYRLHKNRSCWCALHYEYVTRCCLLYYTFSCPWFLLT